jgi:hypothetical protein
MRITCKLIVALAFAGYVSAGASPMVDAVTLAAHLAKIRPSTAAGKLAAEGTFLLQGGNTRLGILKLQDAAALAQQEGSPEVRALASELDNTLSRFGLEPPPPAAAKSLPEPPPSTSSVSDLLEHFNPERKLVVTLLENAYPSAPWFTLRTASVKTFRDDFRRGASDPMAYLTGLTGAHRALADDWLLNHDELRRVMVIGSREDSPAVHAWAEGLRRQGFAVYFYDFCMLVGGQLCPSEVVGAFFATAGHVVLFDSKAARLSSYVTLEVATAQELRGLRDHTYVFTPADLLNAAGVTGATILVRSSTLDDDPFAKWRNQTPDLRIQPTR